MSRYGMATAQWGGTLCYKHQVRSFYRWGRDVEPLHTCGGLWSENWKEESRLMILYILANGDVYETV